MTTSRVRLRTIDLGRTPLTRGTFKQLPSGIASRFEKPSILCWVCPDGQYWLLFEANGRLFREPLIPLFDDKDYVYQVLSEHEQIFLAD